MMKRNLFFLFLLVFLNPICLLSLHKETLLSPSGVSVEIVYRAFEPGEIIGAEIKDLSNVKKAQILFLNRKYAMGKGEINSGLLAFIGIDLSLEPGLYLLEVFINRIDDEWERVQKQIPVQAKQFPLKKLWVEEKFIKPPPEFHDRIELESQILKFLYETSSPQWLGEGGFILPSSGKANPNFGERRIYNNEHRSSHRGVDISSPYGSPVLASNSGKVVLASGLYFAGKTVIIDHGLGVFTLYCHFSKIRVKRGDLVKKGEIIGEIGATGRVTGPHLHWGVKVSGSSTDPFSLLSLILE